MSFYLRSISSSSSYLICYYLSSSYSFISFLILSSLSFSLLILSYSSSFYLCFIYSSSWFLSSIKILSCSYFWIRIAFSYSAFWTCICLSFSCSSRFLMRNNRSSSSLSLRLSASKLRRRCSSSWSSLCYSSLSYYSILNKFYLSISIATLSSS